MLNPRIPWKISNAGLKQWKPSESNPICIAGVCIHARRSEVVLLMKQKKLSSNDLRSKAEEALNSVEDFFVERSGQDIRRLVHELQVHQVELEMQNEELRSTQEELEKSRTCYAELYDFAPVGYLTFDQQGLIVEANLTAANQLSTERAILLGKPFSLFLLKGDRDIFRLHLAQVFKTKERQICEVQLNPRKSEGFFARLDSILIEDSSGDGVVRTSIIDISCSKHAEEVLKRAYGELEDRVAERITELSTANEQLRREMEERKRAEQALLESKSKLEAALASMTDAVFISDAQGRFIDFNDAFATYHRFKSRDECAKTLAEYPDILDVYMADGQLAPLDQWAVPRALRGETATSAEYTLRRKDTGETWIGSYSFGPIRNKDGEIVGSVVAGRDITERKQMEDNLRNAHDSLNLKVRELREKSENLEEVNTALKVLLRQREEDKKDLGESVLANVRSLIDPYVEKLKNSQLSNSQRTLVEILESHVNEIVSPFCKTLGVQSFNLTPAELRVAGFIRDGKSTDEIAGILCISQHTVSTYRDNIREKLGLRGNRTNLRSYLLSIA
jgi:PAS domain S-box-containing protein